MSVPMSVPLAKKSNTQVFNEKTFKACVYYQTTVVRWDYFDQETGNAGMITLAHDGHRTQTTKRRINQALQEWGLPYTVRQKNGDWLVINTDNGSQIPWIRDDLTIAPVLDLDPIAEQTRDLKEIRDQALSNLNLIQGYLINRKDLSEADKKVSAGNFVFSYPDLLILDWKGYDEVQEAINQLRKHIHATS